jgi:toxin-antitoxin system PIN domain toxin
VIAVDTNILVYAHRADSEHFETASDCLERLAGGRAAWAIPWPCLHEFLAVVTHPRIYDPPTPVRRALEQVEIWIESPTLTLLAESEDHWRELRAIVAAAQITGPRIHDARIAALCTQHGVRELWSVDRDFSRFPGLRTVNPLLDR